MVLSFFDSFFDYSSGSSSESSSLILNTLTLYGKIPFSKRPIISSLASENFLADYKTFYLICLFLFSLFNFVWSSIASSRVIS